MYISHRCSYSWSDSIAVDDMTSSTHVLQCSPEVPVDVPPGVSRSLPFFFHVRSSVEVLDSVHGLKQRRLVFEPPIRLTNLLPCEVRYRILSEDGHQMLENVADPGQKIRVHKVNPKEPSYLLVSVGNQCWSRPGLITGDPKHLADHLLVPDTAGGAPLHVKLENRSRVDYLRTLYIYVERWIVNRTGLPVVLRGRGQIPAWGQSSGIRLSRFGQTALHPREWFDLNDKVHIALSLSLSVCMNRLCI